MENNPLYDKENPCRATGWVLLPGSWTRPRCFRTAGHDGEHMTIYGAVIPADTIEQIGV